MLAVLLRLPSAEAVEERLFLPGQTLHAPHLLDVEVAQVLRRYARTGAVPEDQCGAALRDLADMPIHRYPHGLLLQRVWALRNNVTAYDAVYVALAEALDAPLLTRDRRLAGSPLDGARIDLV